MALESVGIFSIKQAQLQERSPWAQSNKHCGGTNLNIKLMRSSEL
jgi:hypothetical protein